ncbi:WD domain, G-beta repeat [Carpediemonas membranifera]|uniref:WD domain, G-beta repeat n=1 Tax=Carpediemonas membranifera TaxID=201153 RepID=A0A8J6E1I1_9EUKA|nr:WD domain, G-beta repeat [Carpediemonas membranifera]|eukprot:KAG9396384.1 WD domain, G-beta repeat [Carpediemonas membranifera]
MQTDPAIKVQQSSADTVTSIDWHPSQNIFAVGSWDTVGRCFMVDGSGQASSKLEMRHPEPIMDVCFNAVDGAQVFTCSTDKSIKVWDLASQQSRDVGQHGDGVIGIKYVKEFNMLVSGSWDRSLAFWDWRAPRQQLKTTLAQRVVDLDQKGNYVVAALEPRAVNIKSRFMVYDIRNPNTPFQDFESAMTEMITCIGINANTEKICYGNSTGRCGVQDVQTTKQTTSYFTRKPQGKKESFTFKSHRDMQASITYQVNCVAAHPTQHKTMFTAGSDGRWASWDIYQPKSIHSFQTPNRQPITAMAINAQGNILAYAQGYDWHKGYEYAPQAKVGEIFLQPLRPEHTATQ